MSHQEDITIKGRDEKAEESIDVTIDNRSEKFREEVDDLTQRGDFLRDIAKKCERRGRCYEPIDVIADAYEIGQRRIRDGKEIPNTEAWLRVTIWNLLYSKQRQLNKEKKILVSLTGKNQNSGSGEGISPEEQIPALPDPDNLYYVADITAENNRSTKRRAAVKSAIKKLSPFQQRIVNAKHVEGKTWDEIKAMEKFEGKPSALRQHGSRAIAKLRRILMEEDSEFY